MNIDNLSMSHIVQYNPIVYASEEIKKKYISGLIKYINIAGVSKRKYIKAQIVAYKTIINSYEPTENNSYLIDDFKYYILLDLLNIVVFDKKGLSPGKLKKIQFAYLILSIILHFRASALPFICVINVFAATSCRFCASMCEIKHGI